MTKDKSRIQSCIDHINTAVDVDPWAKELVAEMGKEILKAQLSKEDTTSDCISRRGAIDHFKSIVAATSIGGKYNEGFVDGLDFAVEHLKTMPSVHPTYTDAEIQKMQDMESAEVEKAFDLGREDAKAEIVRCKDCKHKGTKNCVANAWTTIFGVTVKDDFYCGLAERRTDG